MCVTLKTGEKTWCRTVGELMEAIGGQNIVFHDDYPPITSGDCLCTVDIDATAKKGDCEAVQSEHDSMAYEFKYVG